MNAKYQWILYQLVLCSSDVGAGDVSAPLKGSIDQKLGKI